MIITGLTYLIVWSLLIWWLIAPFIALAIGIVRGHPVIGIVLGLIPLIGPWAVTAAINSIERTR